MFETMQQTDYLTSLNSPYLEEVYARYLANPSSVDASWQAYFSNLGDVFTNAEKMVSGPSWQQRDTKIIGAVDSEEAARAAKAAKEAAAKGGKGGAPVADAAAIKRTSQESVRAMLLIHAYRYRGHMLANLDPLHLDQKVTQPELDPTSYGFAEADMDKVIFLDGELGFESATLRQILQTLRAAYCGTMAVEFMHIRFPEQRAWLQQRFEAARGVPQLTEVERTTLLDKLLEVDVFENFLQVKYQGTKRFSVQGGDVAIPGVEAVIQKAAELGVENIEIGMPHRGRMNVLTTIMGKPYTELLSIFHGNLDFPEEVGSSGDVKYHLGASSDRVMNNGKSLHLSLAANPSHLEVVNPVVVGKARAKLTQKKDLDRKDKVMSILLHGDAAFAGQGSVPETLSLAELKGYRTGGTVHIIVNNQIGFTTAPRESRFTPYPTDVAKMVDAPIFHVNGDDAEAVAFVCKLATEFRQEFKRDTVVDIICYRKYGHNESDEPMFTQPLMYKAIKQKVASPTQYAEKLVGNGFLTQEALDGKIAALKDQFEKAYEAGKSFVPNKADWLEGTWTGLKRPAAGEHPAGNTGVEAKTLAEIGTALTKVPEGFALNSKIARQLQDKQKMMESGEGIDWAMGEALAFGSLLREGHTVRLSGQDCERGTFSHRHAVVRDQNSEEKYTMLLHLKDELGGSQGRFEVLNSSLSELAVLGFEYGYTLADPNALVMWEAQFGDFANGAQVMIDQFIASGEIKWLRMSGLVMLLPHGYEGQGPEHSSARPERFLQLCAEDNMQVVNCTTPANYYHVLRRQLKRDFRKPLIVMTPKSLLRHKLAVSSLKDMAPGTHFQRVIPETQGLAADKDIKRVVLTSGKVYYDLFEAREAQGINDVAIIRVEQYYPFPERELKEELKRYPNAEVVWCQEEPKNMGAWSFINPLIAEVVESLDRNVRVLYAGRKAAASPAAGYLKIHTREQQELVAEALTVKAASKPAKKGAAA
jgi:2-oxoglutarate dehydrogenase E1 component